MLTVKFIGLGNQDSDEIRRRVEKAKGTPPYPVRLEIINNPSKILQEKINKIPSVVIGDQIITEGKIPSSKELKNLFDEYFTIGHIMEAINRKKINKILVPMDMSEVAGNALQYAKELARRTGAEINILHVGTHLVDASQPLLPQNLEDIKRARMRNIRKKAKEIFASNNLPPVIYELGFPIDVITEASKEHDLIVMGSTGEHGFLDRLLGSISSGVAQKAQCPVLLIPKEFEKLSSSKILCACDPDNIYTDIVDKLLDLSMGSDYEEIHFVEVLPEGKTGKTKLDEKIIEEVLKNNYEDIHFYLDQVTSKTVFEGLNKYAETHEIGVIVMVTEHRKPLEALFHRSETKKMVMDINRPLLVLHSDK